jgi:hypothetical protein
VQHWSLNQPIELYTTFFVLHLKQKKGVVMEPTVRIIKQGHRTRVNQSSFRLVEDIARFLDSKFVIPGTNIRFGLDPILSLFPVVGDFITYLISGALIYTMYNQGASRKVVIKMMLNSTLDAVIGTIPLVGTVFDVFYRSNDRNVKLLREHYFEGKHQGSGNGILAVVVIVCVAVVVLAFYGMYKLLEYIF